MDQSEDRATSADEERRALATRVDEAICAWQDDPEERLAMRRRFYERHAPELGKSEIEFTRWMIARGVLAPVERGGSAWWRRVQARLLYDAELASLLHARGIRTDASAPVEGWLRFVARPEPRTWYRAHHTSVLLGYADGIDEVQLETPAERRLVRLVLARVLFAQAMMEGTVLPFGRLLADPRAPSARMMLDRPSLYPRSYPAPEAHEGAALARLESALVGGIDRRVIGSRLEPMATRVAEWLDLPWLRSIARRYDELGSER